jgi:Fic family protein
MSLEVGLSQSKIIEEINFVQEQIDLHRPIPRAIQERIFQKFRLDWNYHSNAIEGNPYTYGETVTFILHGITAKGKTLKDHLDIKGHNDGIDFLLGLIKDGRALNETDIRNLHKIILVQEYQVDAITESGGKAKKTIQVGQYKSTPNHVRTETGEIHYYATPEETPSLMTDLVAWYNHHKGNPKVHPLVLAALFHHRFVEIHPFDDGNGRLGRILMNLILMQHKYPPVVIKQEDRNNYYSVLSQADAKDFTPLIEYMGALLLESLNTQLKGVLGQDISEPSDIDKEIALFKASLEKEDTIKEKRTKNQVEALIKGSLSKLFNAAQMRYRALNELFHVATEEVEVSFRYGAGKWILNGPIHFKNNWLELPAEEEEEVERILYRYQWKGFRKGNAPFDIQSTIQIRFEEYQYGVNYKKQGPNSLMVKFYHEELSDEEEYEVIEGILKSILSEIREKTVR